MVRMNEQTNAMIGGMMRWAFCILDSSREMFIFFFTYFALSHSFSYSPSVRQKNSQKIIIQSDVTSNSIKGFRHLSAIFERKIIPLHHSLQKYLNFNRERKGKRRTHFFKLHTTNENSPKSMNCFIDNGDGLNCE